MEVVPDSLAEICRYLRDDPALQFDMLNCITGVDFLHTDPKKAAKATWEPHLDIVYHMSSTVTKQTCVLKIKVSRWEDGVEGALPDRPQRVRRVAGCELARARGVRLDGRAVHRASGSAAHPLSGGLGWTSAAKGLQTTRVLPRYSRPLTSVGDGVRNRYACPH